MAHGSEADLARILAPTLAALERHCGVADRFVDKNAYRIHLATLWANLVMDPAACGLDEDDLEAAHDVIDLAGRRVLGEEQSVVASFRFLNSPDGQRAVEQARLTRSHRDLLAYFCSMILDPDGHRRAMEKMRRS